jgi:glycerol-3-phosphate dehydrogenase
MPISEQVAMVLHQGKSVEQAARELMERPLREELEEHERNRASESV